MADLRDLATTTTMPDDAEVVIQPAGDVAPLRLDGASMRTAFKGDQGDQGATGGTGAHWGDWQGQARLEQPAPVALTSTVPGPQGTAGPTGPMGPMGPMAHRDCTTLRSTAR